MAGEGFDEPVDGFGVNRLGAVERDLPAGQIDALHLVGAIAADAKIVAEIGAAGDLGTIVVDRAQPVERALHEARSAPSGRKRADIERLQRVQDQSHVVIERHPVDIGRLRSCCRARSGSFPRLASRLAWLTATPLGSEVEPEVYCRKAMSSGFAALGPTARDLARPDRPPATDDRGPKTRCVNPCGPQIGSAGQHDRGFAIGDDRGAGIARAVPARHHHRNRNHARDQAAEERDDEFEAGRKHQHGAVPGFVASRNCAARAFAASSAGAYEADRGRPEAFGRLSSRRASRRCRRQRPRGTRPAPRRRCPACGGRPAAPPRSEQAPPVPAHRRCLTRCKGGASFRCHPGRGTWRVKVAQSASSTTKLLVLRM